MRPHRWQPTRLRRPWDCPGKRTGVGCHCLLHLLSIVDFYSVTSFFLRLQSSQTYAESFTRTNSTMYINNYEHTQKPGKLFKKLFFMMCRVFSYWITFSLSKIWSLKDEIIIISLFWSLSYSVHSPFNLPLTPPHSLQKFFPFGVSFPSICSS